MAGAFEGFEGFGGGGAFAGFFDVFEAHAEHVSWNRPQQLAFAHIDLPILKQDPPQIFDQREFVPMRKAARNAVFVQGRWS